MKISERLRAERRFIEQQCGTDRICDKCWATLETYADACVADLSDMCPGFAKIESARMAFAMQVAAGKLIQ